MKRALLVLPFVAACGGGGDAGPDATVCGVNQPPSAPDVLSPQAGRMDVIPGELVITTSLFTDPDVGDQLAETEFEIWSVSDGVPVTRVWFANVAGTSATIADGTTEWAIEEWERYVVRARHRDDGGGGGECGEWSDWSDDVPFITDDGSTALFDPAVMHDIELTIPPESWDAINAEAEPPGCVPFSRTYYRADLVFDGVAYPNVGVHIKGGCGSSRNLSEKASFKVKLDWDDPDVPGCPSNRRLAGQKHLTLNNEVQDRTMLHERLAYETYQALGVPTPRASSVRVSVNGSYWGVYTHVESIDRRFLDRWFESNGGMLYEGTYWCDLIPANVPVDEQDTECLSREFKTDECTGAPDPGDDPTTYEPLRELVNAIAALPQGQFYPEIEEFFEFDRFLYQWAFESVISHWDAYVFQIMNNYRVYHDPVTDKWTVIPTGVDQTFLGDQNPWNVGGVLGTRCVAEPDCNAAFAAKLDEVNQLFQSAGLAARATTYYNQIRPDVLTDPRKEYSNADFDNAFNGLLDYIVNRPARVEQHLSAHGF